MAKDVKFNIHLKIDGRDQVVTASTNVKELAEQLGIARTKGEAFRDALLISTQITQGISNLTSGLQQLTGIMGQYTKAAAAQEQVETQLATVMRQRMSATEEDIQGIKELTAAQQQLGIIGDEVQLAGVQQIATFLNQKSSIEALLPAMNDLLAQQHGYEASASDAVSVANMMGKVMQGQTSALKRVGITFTAAQEQLLKFGDESQRAATLAQVITDNVGHMNAELAKTDAGKAKQASNYFGDLKEKVGGAFSSIEPTIVAVAELGLALNAVGTTVTAVKTVTIAIKNLGVVTRLTSTISAAFSAVTGAVGTTSAGSAVGVTALGVAVRGLMIATGVGAAIAALTLVIGALAGKSDEATAAQKNLAKAAEQAKNVAEAGNRAYTDAAASLKINIARTKDFNGTKAEEKKLVSELNNTYGSTMGYFSSVSQWYNALVANSKDYCRQMVIEARTRQLANQIAEEMQTQKDIRFNDDGSLKTYDTTNKKQLIGGGVGAGVSGGGGMGLQYVEVEGSSEHAKAQRDYEASKKRQLGMEKEMNALLKEQVNITVKGAPTAPTGTTPTHSRTGNTSDTTSKQETPAALGSLDAYEEKLNALRKQIFATSDEAVATTLQAEYKQVEAEYKAAKIRIGLELPEKEVVQKDLEEKYSTATIAPVVDPKIFAAGSATDKRQSYANAQNRVARMQQDFEIGLIGADEVSQQLVEINAELFKMGLEPIEIHLDTDEVETARTKFDAATDAVQAMGSSFSSLGSALEMPALDAVGTLAQAIATMIMGYATATAEAAKLGPAAWVSFGAIGLAQLAALIKSVKGMGAFAKGGVVSGPTLALVGEYSGAGNNPEVIAPLDKLRSMLPQGGIGGDVHFRIEGRDLVGVISNETRISGKSGHKSNIR